MGFARRTGTPDEGAKLSKAPSPDLSHGERSREAAAGARHQPFAALGNRKVSGLFVQKKWPLQCSIRIKNGHTKTRGTQRIASHRAASLNFVARPDEFQALTESIACCNRDFGCTPTNRSTTSPFLKNHERGNAAHAVALGRIRGIVDVQLSDLDRAQVLTGQLLDHRRDLPARSAPGRPKVHQHRPAGLQNLASKLLSSNSGTPIAYLLLSALRSNWIKC